MPELLNKSDVMRIINAENAVVLCCTRLRSTDEVLCSIASQINSLQTVHYIGEMPTVHDIDRAAILRLCDEIEDFVSEISKLSEKYLIYSDCKSILDRTKAIGKELTGDAGGGKAGMTIEEAIQHCMDEAGKNRARAVECANAYDREGAESCHECAAEHEQLAAWLEELREKRCKVIVQANRIKDLEALEQEALDKRAEAYDKLYAAYAKIDELVLAKEESRNG